MKGQGTTEYLIILAVIIVVALVVAGVMGWFPGAATAITEQQSKAYWQATFGGTGVTCTTGQAYQYNVVITYNVENGLQGAKLTGQKPLVGTCS